MIHCISCDAISFFLNIWYSALFVILCSSVMSNIFFASEARKFFPKLEAFKICQNVVDFLRKMNVCKIRHTYGYFGYYADTVFRFTRTSKVGCDLVI